MGGSVGPVTLPVPPLPPTAVPPMPEAPDVLVLVVELAPPPIPVPPPLPLLTALVVVPMAPLLLLMPTPLAEVWVELEFVALFVVGRAPVVLAAVEEVRDVLAMDVVTAVAVVPDSGSSDRKSVV